MKIFSCVQKGSALVIMGWLFMVMSVQAASFDCKSAASKIEKLICDDDELSKLDDDLSKAYQLSLEQSDDKQKATKDQRKWLKEVRNACQDENCLKTEYQKRIGTSIQIVAQAADNAQQNLNNSMHQKETLQMNQADLQVRGKQLRAAVDKRYRQLDEKDQINPQRGNNIDDVVTPFIAIGSSFDEAEIILRAAGFKVSPRQKHPYIINQYLVYASIDPYALKGMGKTGVTITLEPKNPNDWSSIEKLSAAIFSVYP